MKVWGGEGMNLDAIVTRGRLPWSPSKDAASLDVWLEYEVPLVGTFEVAGQTVLFRAIGDATENTSVWAYVCLSAAEADDAASREFESAVEMRKYTEELFANSEAVFALAHDLKIRRWSRREVQDNVLESVNGFLGEVLKSMREQPKDAVTRFEASLAQVEATEELIEA